MLTPVSHQTDLPSPTGFLPTHTGSCIELLKAPNSMALLPPIGSYIHPKFATYCDIKKRGYKCDWRSSHYASNTWLERKFFICSRFFLRRF